jgi:hypothetical protein
MTAINEAHAEIEDVPSGEGIP